MSNYPSFKVVTKGYDWGPGYSKLIIDLKSKVNQINKDLFEMKAQKNIVLYHPETKSIEEKIGKEKVEILASYLSDASGNKVTDDSQYITLKLSVHPDNAYTNPFKYDFKTGLNHYEPIDYSISLLQGINDIEGNEIKPFTLTNKDCVQILEPEISVFDMDTFNYTDEKFGEIELSYASYKPDQTPVNQPLIILLHGAGEGGTDPRIALYGNKSVALASKSIQDYFGGAYVLVPQTPTMWMDSGDGTYTKTGDSKYTNALLALIHDFIQNNQIDTNRIYLGGGSNGGYMTINLLLQEPKLFTAAFPICQAYASEWITDTQLEQIKNIPLWFIHGENDEVVPFETTAKDIIERLERINAKEVKVTTFENVRDTTGKYKNEKNEPYKYNDHWSWIPVYNDEVKENGQSLFEWLASKS